MQKILIKSMFFRISMCVNLVMCCRILGSEKV